MLLCLRTARLAAFLLCLLNLGTHLSAQSFTNPRRIPTGSSPSLVLVGDLNNDGRLDIVYILNQFPQNFIHPLLATATGSYTEAPTVTLPNNSFRCLLSDVNQDGFLDLLCGTNGGENQSIVMLPGRGDGTFGTPVYSPTPTIEANMGVLLPVAIADFNHDGKPDVALSLLSSYPRVLTMLGDGTGNFTYGTQTPTGNFGVNATVADLNNDGNLDLYMQSVGGMSAIQLFGHPDGSFDNRFGTINGVLADVDGDGHLDIIGGGTSLLAYHGNADGSFNSTAPLINQSFPAGNSTTQTVANLDGVLAYHDVNGDGIPDVLANSGDGLTVLLGKPGLTFSVASHVPVAQDLLSGPLADSIVPVDIDGDGNLDLVAAGPQGVYITYGRADGTFASATSYESGANVTGGVVADLNGDGFADVITTGDLQLNLSLGRGDGTFRPSQPIGNSAIFPSDYQRPLFGAIVHGDFNGDGFQDLLVTGSTDVYSKQPYLFLGKGDGMFAAPVTAPADATYILQTSVADLNHDGRSDLAFADLTPFQVPTIVTYLGQTNGSFVRQTTPYPGGAFKLADMDGDGKPDLISVSGQTVTIMPGRGDGTFAVATATLTLPSGLNSGDFTIGDFDGDGKPDIALLNGLNYLTLNTLTRLYNNGYPAFSAPITSPIVPAFTSTIFAADLNGDGIADIIYDNGSAIDPNGVGPAFTFVTGARSRTISAENTIVAGRTLLFPTAIDLNGDGRLDLITGNGDYNRHANTFTVLLNQGNIPQATGSLVATPEPSRLQNPFQLTATITPPPAYTATITGSVTFSIDGTVLGSAPLVNNVATLTAPANITRGTHALTATWPGQRPAGPNSAIDALTLTGFHTVVGLPSITTLAASAISVPAGTPITFTATTTVPGGPVPDLTKLQILEGTKPLQPTAATSSNSLTTTVILASGTHTLLATFAGDTTAEPSTSAPITITVAAAPTTLSLNLPGGPAFQSTTIAATAQFAPPPATPPGGTVLFTLNGQPLGTAALTSTNSATLGLSEPAGTYAIHAAYTPATSAVTPATADGTLTIARAPVALSFTSPLLPTPAGQSTPVILGASFSDLTGRHLATGTILPSIDGTSQPPLPLPAQPTFTYTVAGLAPGIHSVTLTYPGDANFLPATTATAIVTILNRDFAFSGAQTLTIPTQHYRSLPVTLTSIGDFAGPVALSCADLPAYASCRFSRAPIPLTANSAASFNLTVDTSAVPAYLASNRDRPSNRDRHSTRVLAAFLCPLALLPLALASRRRAPSIFALLLSAAAIALTGCSGQYPNHTPPGTYTIQVVGQSADGTIVHKQPITLVVTP